MFEDTRNSSALTASMATLTGAIGNGSKWLLDKIVGGLAATGVNPNFLTFLGLVVNFGAAAMFAMGHFRTGALVILFAGFLDMLDGQVARRQKRVTAFGAFYDSTLDRYADMALYMGLLVYYSVSGHIPYVVLAAVATAGSVMVSYARARAESLIPQCKVGFMERPERLVLLIIGGIFNRMGPVLWVIAVVSTITVIHRIVYTWQETRAGRTLPGIRLST
jgi:CDP-diacylglycerol--glycerol-3-phosphate 3-phosphatidyltransferase